MNSKAIYLLVGAAIVVILAVFVLNIPDRRSGTERVGDAIQTLPEGPKKAADQLGDRNPVEKAGDAIEKKTD
ncbi:hypothetical protein AEAC466_00910 [Asticcacaulis sp. AC466]|uniref:hypothetical protein n=1 Tax=Asticcacaulis sp. AC466 TaxID=1282362 RepID=UPI0003C40B51|nr:hypothetical protein [Asticcacaulis sp. AC466]ESQ85765.1 hypothetical protein AEAC466_00910 [Asticcacaulis sp. AC466]